MRPKEPNKKHDRVPSFAFGTPVIGGTHPAHLRQERITDGVLAVQGGLYQFTQDYTFSARSTANGRIEWQAADGRTLKEIREAEAGQ